MSISIWNALVFQGMLLSWNWVLFLLHELHIKQQLCAVWACSFYSPSGLQILWDGEMPVAFWLPVRQNRTALIYSNLGSCWLHASVVPFHWVLGPKLWEVHHFQTSVKNVFLIGKLMSEIEKDVTKEREKGFVQAIQFIQFLQSHFPGLITK